MLLLHISCLKIGAQLRWRRFWDDSLYLRSRRLFPLCLNILLSRERVETLEITHTHLLQYFTLIKKVVSFFNSLLFLIESMENLWSCHTFAGPLIDNVTQSQGLKQKTTSSLGHILENVWCHIVWWIRLSTHIDNSVGIHQLCDWCDFVQSDFEFVAIFMHNSLKRQTDMSLSTWLTLCVKHVFSVGHL